MTLMTVADGTLGIVAGGGDLPITMARAVRDGGRAVFVLALTGSASPAGVESFPHAWVSLGELGKAVALLKNAGCSDVTFAGKVGRPEFTQLKLDSLGILALPRIAAAAANGDDALLRAVLTIFEKEGMRVVGSDDVVRDLLAPIGPLGRIQPNEKAAADISQAIRALTTLGSLDIGQALVVCGGLVLAVEAAEGTDAMLERVAGLPEALRGTAAERKGVLLKGAKPHQERRIDLPVVGIRSVELAAAAGLAGIAVEAGTALILDRVRVIEAADRHGLFIFGFSVDQPK
jgi:UDP-2,3-diacylglucosamine hydrolase